MGSVKSPCRTSYWSIGHQ